MNSHQESFKKAMSHFATGVCVVTYKNPTTNKADGVTISAFSSLSLEPAKILFCLGQWSQSYKDFAEVSEFVVNILDSEQKSLAYQFAGKDREGLEEVITEVDGVPALKNTLATVVCKKGNQYAEGDHDIIIGDVSSVSINEKAEAQPLLYYKADIVGNYIHKP